MRLPSYAIKPNEDGHGFAQLSPHTVGECERRIDSAARKRDACSTPLAMLTYQQEIDWLLRQQKRIALGTT